jgi:hypothetical protein
MGQVAPDAPEPDSPSAPTPPYVPNPAEHKLIAALRSGEFKQGKLRLRPTSNTFCCLGVACELYRRETGQGEWVPAHDDEAHPSLQEFVMPDEGTTSGVLSPSVRKWLGWASDKGSTSEACLAERNDSGATFSEIADLIEQGKVERA